MSSDDRSNRLAGQGPVEDGVHAARMLLPRCSFDAATEELKARVPAQQTYDAHGRSHP
jgi:hypothetical protein